MSPDEVEQLLDELEELDYHERLPLAERAVQLSDAMGDERLAWQARFALVTAAVFGGVPEKALVNFAWLESKSAQDPERFPASRAVGGLFLSETDVLWAYKWVGLHLAGFASIPRPEIESVLERMLEQYTKHNVSLRPYWLTLARAQRDLGEPTDVVLASFAKSIAAPRDAYADCVACEWNARVEMALLAEDIDEAVRCAQLILDRPYSCAEVPQLTHSAMVVPLWRAGLKDMARMHHKRGYEISKSNPEFLTSIADHLDFRLLDSDWEGAVDLARTHEKWAAATRSDYRRLRFLVSVRALHRMAPKPAGLREFGDVADVDHQVSQLVARFDTRNGNDATSRWLAERDATFSA
ncbi:MAG: hypothetical protein R3E66_07055 [bacterium]